MATTYNSVDEVRFTHDDISHDKNYSIGECPECGIFIGVIYSDGLETIATDCDCNWGPAMLDKVEDAVRRELTHGRRN